MEDVAEGEMFSKTNTWQIVLQEGRNTKSPDGGWNYKRYWIDRGLEEMLPKNHFVEWTYNSLKTEDAREKSFQIADRIKALECGERGKDGTPTKETENEFNWKLSKYLHKHQYIFTYELPLKSSRENQLIADVAMFGAESHQVEICELKIGDNNKDSPLLAFVELMCYATELTKCWDDLSKELPHPFDLRVMNLIIAAPTVYWEYWFDEEYSHGWNYRNFEHALNSIAVGSVYPALRSKDTYLETVNVLLAKDKSGTLGKDGLELLPPLQSGVLNL